MVAIIAILAAIAVPNFLEAQTRAKVSRSKADMRSLATAIEAYAVDNNVYPMIAGIGSQLRATKGYVNGPSVFYEGYDGISSRMVCMTTPISYITSVFRDPFINPAVKFALDGENPATPPPALPDYDTYDYVDARSLTPDGVIGSDPIRGAAACSGAHWQVTGAGPDLINAFGGGQANYTPIVHQRGVDYDPSNGTISTGDLVRIGGGPGPLGTIKPAIDRIQNVYNVPIN